MITVDLGLSGKALRAALMSFAAVNKAAVKAAVEFETNFMKMRAVMAIVAGEKAAAMEQMTTKERLKEFYKRLHARPSECHVCDGVGSLLKCDDSDHDGGGHNDSCYGLCHGCKGSGEQPKLAVVVDAMITAGATDADLLEWLGPLLEPERQLGVIRHGGRVNIEMGQQGMVMEGLVGRMEVDHHLDVVDVSSFGGERLSVPGRRTCEVTLSISEYEFVRFPRAPVDDGPCVCVETERGRTVYADCPVHGRCATNGHEWIDITTFGGSGIEQCAVCDIRRPPNDESSALPIQPVDPQQICACAGAGEPNPDPCPVHG